jgi:tetratricopeptide (TPR) repeat protein
VFEDLGGGVVGTMAGASRTGLAEEILGDLERAEALMRPAVETLFAMGEKSFVSTLAAQLGRVLALQGKLDEAARFAEMGREASPADDWASQISWRGALTQVMARRGDLDEAERLAREGVTLTEGVDYLNQMGDAWADLGYVLRLSGRPDDASEALRRALALYEAKGNVVSAGHAQEALSELA